MKRILNKTITLLLILMLILVSSPVASIKSNAEELVITKEIYETLQDYLEVYHPDKEFEDFTNLSMYHGGLKDITINDMSQLKELKNLVELEINGGYFEKIDFTGLTKLNKLKVCDIRNKNYVVNPGNYYGDMYAQITGINTLTQLNELIIWNARSEELDISNMPKIKVLTLNSVRNMEGNGDLVVSNLNNAATIISLNIDGVSCTNLNFSKLNSIKYLTLGALDINRKYTVEELGINELTNIKSFYYRGDYELIGTLSFPNADIKYIRISPSLTANFPNFVVDIRGKDLKYFEFSYNTGFIYRS